MDAAISANAPRVSGGRPFFCLRTIPSDPQARLPWWHYSACRNINPELFFTAHTTSEDAAAAKRLCRGCLVRQQCLEDALSRPDEDDRHGIAGEMTPRERRAERKRRNIT